MNANPQQARSIFLAAVERPAEQRAAYLDEACAADAELRQRVEVLLKAHDQANSLLDQPTSALAAVTDQLRGEGPGTVIGPYKLLQLLGEGGMGAVFLAEQTQPVQRQVALKIIKPGMDSRQVIARFEAERQALALMDHPSIARVYDAGTTESGRPYFVMELVKGMPITTYCDEQHLTPRERLELFVRVCLAVQHAHAKGIIHRDLKPSNVLVTLYDGQPAPKVIDFGIAKATAQELPERTLVTEIGQVVGTLEYMSPEQAELNSQDVDTRSDVYALGVMLYELLTGTTPLERRRLRMAGLLESLRVIREEEPPPPSKRLTTTEGLAGIAANRGVEPKKLKGLVSGELDWIVMKCLEKDRNRRYQTASALAGDVEGHLHDEPVLASPPSASYRLRKFVRRNRGAVLAAALVVLALVGGIIGTSLGLIRATAESGMKDEAINQLEGANKKLGQEQRQAQITLSTFLLDKGLEYCDRGDVGHGLLWLARGLENAPEDAGDLQRVIRTNLAAWQDRLIPLKGVYPQQGPVHLVAFRLDGKSFLTVSEIGLEPAFPVPGTTVFKGEVRRWDTNTREPLGAPIPHRGFATRLVRLSPDGRTALTGKDTQTAQLWDVDTCRPKGAPLAHPGPVAGVEFSRDGRTVLTRTTKTVHLWDAATGKPLGKRLELTRRIQATALAPDGRIVLTASGTTPQLWNALTGEPLGPPLPQQGLIWTAVFHPNGRFVVTSADKDPVPQDDRPVALVGTPGNPRGVVQLWEAPSGKLCGKAYVPRMVHAPDTVAFSPDARWLLMVSDTVDICGVTEVGSLWPPYNLEGGTQQGSEVKGVMGAAIGPDSRTLLLGCANGTARLGTTPTAKFINAWRYEGPQITQQGVISAVAISPDGRTLLTGCADGTARLWETAADSLLERWPIPLHTSHIQSPLLSPEGKTLLIGVSKVSKTGSKTIVALWDVAGQKKIGLPLEMDERILATAFSPDGQRILVSGAVRARTTVQDPVGGKHVQTTDTGASVLWLGERGEWKRTGPPGQPGKTLGIAFGPAGRTVLLGNQDGTARLWDVDRWQPLGPVLAHAGLQTVALSPDGRTGLTASEHQARLWDTHGGQPLGEPLVHQGKVLVATFSPDGSLAATGSADRTVRLWNVSTGAQVGPPLHHSGPVPAVAFSRDGRTLLTGGGAGVGRFWDCATGKPLGFPVPSEGAASVVFCPDGQTVLTVLFTSGSLSVCRWAVPPPPQEGPVAGVALWAQLISGRDLDAANVVGWLTPHTWQASRRRLEELGGPLSPTPDRLAWHRREVEFCIDGDAWFAALWHLERLLEAEPHVWKHYFDRGMAHYSRARFGSLGAPAHPEEMGPAVADFTKAIALGAEGSQVWEFRGQAYSELRQWDRAAADFGKAVALGSDSSFLWKHAEAHYRAGNTEAYQRACSGLLARFGQTRDSDMAYDTARVCLLAARPVVDPARIVPLAETALATAEPMDRDRQLEILALALYRAGRVEAAVQRLTEAVKERETRKQPFPQNWSFLLAMAIHRLGHTNEAWQWLTHAFLTPPQPREGSPESLRGEVEALFGIRRFAGHTEPVWCVAFSPDGSRALTGGWDSTVRLWDVRSGKEVRFFDCRHQDPNQVISAVAFSPDGRRGLASSVHGTVWLWDLETGKELNRSQFRPGGQQNPGIASVAFSPDGRQALLGGHDGVIHVWDLEHWKELRRLEDGVGLWSVDFSPKGRLVVSAGGLQEKGLVRLWDLDTGKEVRRFEGHAKEVRRAVFSPNGRQILSGSIDRTMRLWDVETGKELRQFTGHAGDVAGVTFSRSGRRALSAGNDGTVRLWDLETGKELRRFVGNSAAISPDGRHALTGAVDRTVWLWPLPPEDK